MLKKVGIAMLIVASLGNQANTKLSSEDKEAINTAINFMNEYIEIRDPDELDKWLAKAPITEKFRKEYLRREKHIELGEKALEGKLTPADEKLYEEDFVVDGRKGHQGGTEIMLKLVKQNGKWLIDDSK